MTRGWIRTATAAALAVLMTGAAPAAAEERAERAGADAVHPASGATAAADGVVMMPDLGIAHRLGGGGINLFRLGLSDIDPTYGQTAPVRKLATGGFSYDRSRTVAGDFGDITPKDDGTADHVVWHAAGDGTVRLWVVPGGGDTTPRLWATLGAPWNWANSRPMAADVTGDGWDVLVVRLYRGCSGGYCYTDDIVFVSNGTRLGSPKRWTQEKTVTPGLDDGRFLMADVDGDTRADLVTMRAATGGYTAAARISTGSSFAPPAGFADGTGAGLSFADTRSLAGDLTGDGQADLISIARSGLTGLAVWVQASENAVLTKWQDLVTAGWSYTGSRQYLADTNGDFIDDLVTVHRSGGTGFLVWRHPSNGTALEAPILVDDLRTTGWNWSYSREGVARTIGVMSP
jgi:hypothetical protein